MRNESATHSIMQLSKEIERYAAAKEDEVFLNADEVTLELGALEEYMASRMDELL